MSQPPTLSERIDDVLWGQDMAQIPYWQSRLIWVGRLVYAVARDLTQGHLSLHAMSLVYTTLLSLVPLLAVTFSVLKGFGVHNQVEPLLMSALAPLGAAGHEITTQLIGFVDNMKVGVLGSVGLAMLLYTVISLIQKIEGAFNYAWRITAVRPLAQRFTQYLSVLLVGPVLFFSAVGLSASLSSNAFVQSVMHIAPVGKLVEIASVLAPYLMISLTFAFVYFFVPNTRVRISSALVGALIAGLLWEVLGEIFSTFMVSSTKYTAIYSSLAILILFMIWVYVGWLILLIGASVAFYHQSPELLTMRERQPRLSSRLQERLALSVAAEITQRYRDGGPAWSCERLAKELLLPSATVETVLRMLESAGYLVRLAGEEAEQAGYVPARDPRTITLLELLRIVRSEDEGATAFSSRRPETGVARIETAIETALSRALDGLTLQDLAEDADVSQEETRAT